MVLFFFHVGDIYLISFWFYFFMWEIYLISCKSEKCKTMQIDLHINFIEQLTNGNSIYFDYEFTNVIARRYCRFTDESSLK